MNFIGCAVCSRCLHTKNRLKATASARDTMTFAASRYTCRYHYGRPPRPFYVLLKVGQREFIGDGPTRQAARHSAATKALRVLKSLPVPSESSKPKTEDEEESEGNRIEKEQRHFQMMQQSFFLKCGSVFVFV